MREPAKILRHVVLFSFKESAGRSQIRQIEQAFCDLPAKIQEIYEFEWGIDVSVEHLSQGYTHCFLVTFLSEEDRNKYLPHPAYQEFVSMLQPCLAQALVLDYWANH